MKRTGNRHIVSITGPVVCFRYTIDEHITVADFRNLFFRLVFIRNLVGRFNQTCHDLIELRGVF